MYIYWMLLFVLFFMAMFVPSARALLSNDVKFIEELLAGSGGVLLGMLGGRILLGVFYQTKTLCPSIKERGMIAVVGASICVVTANLIWGFSHSMPYFDIALGLGFSGAGLLWLRHGIRQNWNRADLEHKGA